MALFQRFAGIIFGGLLCLSAGCGTDTPVSEQAQCGNGVLESGETCDGDCPVVCNDENACTIDRFEGKVTECSAECIHETITACIDGDGCCALGCTGDDDSDCTPGSCLEGAVQSQSCGFNDNGIEKRQCQNGFWQDWANCEDPDECANETSQDGDVVCGPNENGVLIQECIDGQWVDTNDCSSSDVCVNGEESEGNTVCGFNNEGVFMQDCIEGQWVDNENCTGNDVCLNGDVQNSEEICGFNNEGFFVMDCVAGEWVLTNTCNGNDVCVNGATRVSDIPCDNGQGFVPQYCSGGQWIDFDDCVRPPDCEEGETRTGTTLCGINNEGFLIQNCVTGSWVDGEVCTGEDECLNGETQMGVALCGINDEGFLMQECITGTWEDTEICTGEDICINGDSRDSTLFCGLNNEGVFVQNCTDGQWATSDICSGDDECTNGGRQLGDTPCGDAGIGFYFQNCISGMWVDSDQCSSEPECDSGDTRNSDVPCGFNLEGVFIESCVNEFWQLTDECTIPDQVPVCVGGACDVTVGALGRALSLATVDFNSTGLNVAAVLPGSSVSLRIEGAWAYEGPNNCPGCITQFYARMNDVFSLCLGSTTGDTSFDKSITFTAPAEPGIYYVNPKASWLYSCHSTSTETLFGDAANIDSGLQTNTMGALIVRAEANFSFSGGGRNLTATLVNVNGTALDSASVAAGAETTIAVEGNVVVDNEAACPECTTQFYVRLNNGFNLCLGSSAEPWTFTETATFNAPNDPGVYFINPSFSVGDMCLDDNSVEEVLGESTVGHLFVTPE